MTRISFGHRIRFAGMPAAVRWNVWHYRVEGIAVRYAKHRYEVYKASESSLNPHRIQFAQFVLKIG